MPPISPFKRNCLALTISQVLMLPAQAATITVNSATDDGANCTLRNAIESSNSNASVGGCEAGDPGVDEIVFDSSVSAVTLGSELPTITEDTTFNGSGVTINANRTARVMTITGASVGLSNLTLTGGLALEGAGIFAVDSTISIQSSSIQGNSTTFSGNGGGIKADSSTINIVDSVLTSNSASRGGGINVSGSSISLNNSSVSGNNGNDRGGGIYSENSFLTILSARVDDNYARGGGAIYAPAGTTLHIVDSQMNDNDGGQCGGISIDSGSLFMSNSSVSGNTANGGFAGICSYFTPIQLFDVSLVNNAGGGGIMNYGSSTSITGGLIDSNGGVGVLAFSSASLTLNNATVSGNIRNGITVRYADLVVNNSTMSGNGGLLGSGVYGVGIDALESSVELNSVTVSGNVIGGINVASSSLSMRDSLLDKNGSRDGGAGFGGSGGISMAYSSVDIIDSEISGNIGGGVSANGQTTLSIINSSVFENQSGNGGGVWSQISTVNVRDSSISNNSASSDGGGIFSINSNFNLVDSTISENIAESQGGGIALHSPGLSSEVFRVTGSKVSDNTASYGAAVHMNFGSSASIRDSEISSNTSTLIGGALYLNDSSATIVNSTIAENLAVDVGGVFANAQSSVVLSNSTVSGNRTLRYGGAGISVLDDSTLNIFNSTISANSTARFGGGVYSVSSRVRIRDSLISGNTAGIGVSEVLSYESATSRSGTNLFGRSGQSNADAFLGFTPSAPDINATSSGTPVSLSRILRPLADNGGATRTHSLVANSPAIDAANVTCLNTDQRGAPRDALCDIGSFEFGAIVPLPPEEIIPTFDPAVVMPPILFLLDEDEQED